MNLEEFRGTLGNAAPEQGWSAALTALWWDARGDWGRAHRMVDELETPEAMAVHAYLHRREGVEWNAEYWYRRAGRGLRRATLEEKWEALAAYLLTRQE